MRRNTPFGELPATSALQAPPSNWAPLRQLVDKVLPTSADALHRKALKLWHSGRSAEALALLEAATERHPGNARLHLDMGRVLVDEGYYADAEWTLSQLAAEHPRHAEVHAALGDLFVQIGQPLLAIASFGQAVKFDPEHTDAHVHLGVAHYELGDLSASAPHLQKAIRLDGKNVVARFFMAQISLQQNDVLRARYQLGMVAKLDPSVDLSRFGENAPPPLTSQTKPREAPLHHWQLPQSRAAQTGHLNRRPGQTQSLND
jgi:tetratricopeptide (TPR) repeat protein